MGVGGQTNIKDHLSSTEAEIAAELGNIGHNFYLNLNTNKGNNGQFMLVGSPSSMCRIIAI